jgi:hypothetical protein
MRFYPMDVPAEIRRWVESTDSGQVTRSEMTVAKGPLVLMAHGLMAIRAEVRESFWITSEAGDLTATQAEEVLRRWSAPHRGDQPSRTSARKRST